MQSCGKTRSINTSQAREINIIIKFGYNALSLVERARCMRVQGIEFHSASGQKDPRDEISIVYYLQPVGSWEALKKLLARGTACIFGQLYSIVTTNSFTLYYFCTPNQSNTPLNHFFQEYLYIHLFLFGLVPLAGRI